MPGEDTHALMIEVAALTRQRDDMERIGNAKIAKWQARAETAESALAAARRECEGLRADLAVSRQANEAARELRKALSDRLERISDALTDCGYTSKQARVAAISVLEEDVAAPAAGEEGKR